MIDHKIAIVGDPSSIFVKEHAAHWNSLGLKVDVITYIWDGPDRLPCGTRVISSFKEESRNYYFSMQLVKKALYLIEKIFIFFGKRKYKKAMGTEKDGYVSFAYSILVGYSVSRFINKSDYSIVVGHEAFVYGLAVSLVKNRAKVLFPWGGDIYMYSETSYPAFCIVKKALNSVDLICPSSTKSIEHIITRFKVNPEKVEADYWGIKVNIFKPSTSEEKTIICKKYGINPNNKIILNVRRFLPAWGSEMALNSLIRIGTKYEDVHFVFFGGQNVEKYVSEAIVKVKQLGISERFTFFDKELSINECAELMSISDLFTSLMLERDMRSASILQAVNSGAFPILSNQQEYKIMMKNGLNAILVDANSLDNVVEAIEQCLNNEELIEEYRRKNFDYISTNEDWDKKQQSLINRILSIKK
jgi:glycosyltransferase involved in cell wall biosynthesis